MVSAADEAIDPVCGMTVTIRDSAIRPVTYEGETYYFCCAGCRQRFESDPGSFLSEPDSYLRK